MKIRTRGKGLAAFIVTVIVGVGFVRALPVAHAQSWQRGRNTIHVSSADELQRVFSRRLSYADVHLAAGEYDLTPTAMIDSTCGNCEDVDTPVPVTVGLRMSGRRIRLTGASYGPTVIRTHAGYGILIEDCKDCRVENLTITGGERDTDGRATDAAIVVKHATATIRGNTIENNIGDSTVVNEIVVGIIGIAGREGADIKIENNRIRRNSWDGIALYRGAQAVISDNVIDGVDKARGKIVGGGRGVGIGVTWDARATIERNLVTRYWKGIGLFVDAEGTVRDNIVEDVITWGITLWDAGKGTPSGRIEGNIIYKTGACGAAITRQQPGETPGAFTDNVLVETGQNRKYDDPEYYCRQCALALEAVPENFVIRDNVFFGNRRATDDLPDFDISEAEFRERLRMHCRRLAEFPALGNSLFLKTHCAED
jgi:parallel beta-helix repeat protein